MPKDARFPFRQDSTGDIDSVEDEEFYRRHILQLGLLASTDVQGSGATANDAIELESAIRDRLLESPYISEPVRVTVPLTDNDEELRARIDVPEMIEYDIPLTEPDA